MANKFGSKGVNKSNNSAVNKRQREQIEQDKLLKVVDQAFYAQIINDPKHCVSLENYMHERQEGMPDQ